MRQNNLIAWFCIICGLASGFDCATATSTKSDDVKIIPTAQRSVEMSQDSTFVFFSLEDDTVFIGKKFPPEGVKIEEGIFFPTDTNISESNAIHERIKTSIDTVQYHYLKAHDVWISLTIYVDSTGIIRETQIRLKRQFEGFFTTKDLRNICMSVKGLKFTLPPEFRHLPYAKFSFGFKFK